MNRNNLTIAEKNKLLGAEFLKQNACQKGVITTSSGLQYKIIKEGNGEIPTLKDKVIVHYVGKLIDGTEFDSSYKRGKPAVFPVNKVIAGWTEALTKMRVGSLWQLFIPPELAYGQVGAPPLIGPNATLIFDVELLGIQYSKI